MVILWVNRCLVAASRPSLWVRCSRVTCVAICYHSRSLRHSVKAVFFPGCFNLKMDPLKMYFPLKMGIVQPAMLDYRRVAVWLEGSLFFRHNCITRNIVPKKQAILSRKALHFSSIVYRYLQAFTHDSWSMSPMSCHLVGRLRYSWNQIPDFTPTFATKESSQSLHEKCI